MSAGSAVLTTGIVAESGTILKVLIPKPFPPEP